MNISTPPLVSVIVPAYNREKIICETLDSVFAQTHRPIELIVVDDGSTDRTKEVVELWISEHELEASTFMAYCLIQSNRRAPAARNNGLRRASGKFIQFLDSDDVLYADAISLKVSAIESGPFEYSYTRNHLVDKMGRIVGSCGSPWPVNGGAIGTYLFDTIAPLFPKYFFDQIGLWDESLISTDEIELHGRIKARFGEGAFIDKFCHAARDHDGPRVSITRIDQCDSSAYRVLGMLFSQIEGTPLNNIAERNAISRFGCGVVESYALSQHPEFAMKSFELARILATGRRSLVLKILGVTSFILPRDIFLRVFVYVRYISGKVNH